MDYSLCSDLKRGKRKALDTLFSVDLRRFWFMCNCITKDVKSAAPLLLQSWDSAIETILSNNAPPTETFCVLLSHALYQRTKKPLESEPDFEDLLPPKIAEKYQPFLLGIERLQRNERLIYLLFTFGGLSANAIADLEGITFADAKKLISSLTTKVLEAPEVKALGAAAIRRSAEFRNSDASAFSSVEVPPIITATLERNYQVQLQSQGKTVSKQKTGKENRNMRTNTTQKRTTTDAKKGNKFFKPILICSIAFAVILASVLLLPKLFSGKSSTRIVTYSVEAVSYGNVTQTISGSGTLTPISKKTITTSGGEVSEVNFSVGDEVEEGDVIAVINGMEYVAPYDGILLEMPLTSGETVTTDSTVAMIMGKDGFTMGIAVDETEISSVALDQEVTFSIDALGEEYTGNVSKISYNGSSNGSSVAYQITTTVDYIEGVYPGMSATAEIVIEDSGEGLIVPVSAVKTSGDEKYIYLAPDKAKEGDSYDEDDIDESKLTQILVETGMSDGSYIIIESDEVEDGDCILIQNITSTETGSDSDNSTGGGRGGFPGVNGDFNFSDFDPSQMPQGGGDFSGFKK